MFEIIGIVSVWVLGLVASFFIPLLVTGKILRIDDGLSSLMVGQFWGKVIAVVYLLTTVAYFAAT